MMNSYIRNLIHFGKLLRYLKIFFQNVNVYKANPFHSIKDIQKKNVSPKKIK